MASHHHTPELSSIPDLFKKSWSVLTDALFNALMISIGSAVSSFLLVILGFLVALLMLPALTGSSIGQIFSDSFDPTTLLTPQFFIGSGVFMLVFLIIASIISGAFSSAFVLAFFHAADKPRVRDLIKQGFGVAGWLVVYGIVSSLLVLGGFGFLVLPAIAMGFLFMFGTYEVIVAKKKPIAALQRSTTVVIEHFGDIFVRIILFFLLNVAVVYLLPAIFSAISEEVGAIYSVINMIISIVLSWYGTAYGIQLYKEASGATPENKKRKGIFSALLIISVIGFFLFGALVSFAVSQIPDKFYELQKSATTSEEMQMERMEQMFDDLEAIESIDYSETPQE